MFINCMCQLFVQSFVHSSSVAHWSKDSQQWYFVPWKKCFKFYRHDLGALWQSFAVPEQFGCNAVIGRGSVEPLGIRDRFMWKHEKGTRSEERHQAAKERGHFPCKEIKVKRPINVWFPASWSVFCTEIPFFLSAFAETTITPLPVWVTLNHISVRQRSVTFTIAM